MHHSGHVLRTRSFHSPNNLRGQAKHFLPRHIQPVNILSPPMAQLMYAYDSGSIRLFLITTFPMFEHAKRIRQLTFLSFSTPLLGLLADPGKQNTPQYGKGKISLRSQPASTTIPRNVLEQLDNKAHDLISSRLAMRYRWMLWPLDRSTLMEHKTGRFTTLLKRWH